MSLENSDEVFKDLGRVILFIISSKLHCTFADSMINDFTFVFQILDFLKIINYEIF